jgi:hypothetical protein
MSEPKTLPEMLDAAAAKDDNGQAFGGVLGGLFRALETAIDQEDQP